MGLGRRSARLGLFSIPVPSVESPWQKNAPPSGEAPSYFGIGLRPGYAEPSAPCHDSGAIFSSAAHDSCLRLLS